MKAFLLLFTSLILIQPVSACSCGTRSLAEELKVTHAVFVGRCISKTFRENRNANEFVFAVESAWKLAVPERISVFSVPSGTACGYVFTVGQRYAVWTYIPQSDNVPWTNICTRTTEADSPDAKKDLPTLGAPKVPHALTK